MTILQGTFIRPAKKTTSICLNTNVFLLRRFHLCSSSANVSCHFTAGAPVCWFRCALLSLDLLFLVGPVPAIYEEAIKRKDLKLLLAIIKTNVEAQQCPPFRLVAAATRACVSLSNVQAANTLYSIMMERFPLQAYSVLGHKARILISLGRWEELSVLLFQERIPRYLTHTRSQLRQTVLSS